MLLCTEPHLLLSPHYEGILLIFGEGRLRPKRLWVFPRRDSDSQVSSWLLHAIIRRVMCAMGIATEETRDIPRQTA